MVNVPVIWVLGGPGCGKGTQCAKIVEKYGFTHLSTGDLLRAEVESGSKKGQELAEVMKAGELVSNKDVLCLLSNAIQAAEKDAKGFLIDGYPREKEQGAEFEKCVAKVDLILYFNCSDETLVQRIMARASASAVQRADDNEETLKTRIKTFRNNTNVILEQYLDRTCTINAERDVNVIFADVVAAMDRTLESKRTQPPKEGDCCS